MPEQHTFCGVRSALLALIWCVAGVSATSVPNVTDSGDLPVNKADGSQIFYSYYEAQGDVSDSTPIILWLQVCHPCHTYKARVLGALHAELFPSDC